MGLKLGSTAFFNNSPIPEHYTCSGIDKSPPLAWYDANKTTKSYVLIVDDPDAPAGIWVHWVLFNIPADMTLLPEGAPIPKGAVSGKNSWGSPGYRGPCPPPGRTHRYFFKIYALDTVLDLTDSATKQDVEKAMNNHIIDQGEYIGLYSRK
ncbi:YbhB/YbcL family Raf kinase inhibitor-like protein [Legionella sp. W05-934-2]|uniref:YbhB/YbcL family Raf kinase inhibitor-like protein n=1 Tax=Legionella sp. W05-934-2 TaxID=1198649 RepID=UPI003462E506